MLQSGVPSWSNRSGKSSRPLPNAIIEFVVDVKRRRVVVRFRNRITLEDIAHYAKQLASHPGFQPTFSEITDLRDVEELDLQADDYLKLADEVDPFSPDAKRAFVVRTQVQSHAARLHRILRAKRNVQIFESFEDAEGWVGE